MVETIIGLIAMQLALAVIFMFIFGALDNFDNEPFPCFLKGLIWQVSIFYVIIKKIYKIFEKLGV